MASRFPSRVDKLNSLFPIILSLFASLFSVNVLEDVITTLGEDIALMDNVFAPLVG